MSLINSNTKWVLFLSTSHPEPDERHVLDLVFGLLSLERAGIPPQNISIYVDGNNRSNIDKLFSLASNYQYSIQPSSSFFSDLNNNTNNNIVMFVTGHGSHMGIDAPNAITPHQLLRALKTAPVIDKAVVYLGQCFAGVFNYVNAGRNKADKHDPEVVFLGATDLHESLSSSTSEQFLNDQVSWVANLFLLHVFKWISSPSDIDGDNKHTIMDSYKYAGVMSNMHNKQSKANGFGQMIHLYELLKQAETAAMTSTGNPAQDIKNKLTLQSLATQYTNLLAVNYVHQECWILNSIPAQYIEI